jgi:hypothetical protein
MMNVFDIPSAQARDEKRESSMGCPEGRKLFERRWKVRKESKAGRKVPVQVGSRSGPPPFTVLHHAK